MTRFSILVVLCIASFGLKAQVGISYYPFQSEVGINSNVDKLLWGDLRLASNTFYGNITTETNVMWNVKRYQKVSVYTGLGANFNFFNAAGDLPITNGYAAFAGCRFRFSKAWPGLQLAFEISPYFNTSFSGGTLRSKLGLAYQF